MKTQETNPSFMKPLAKLHWFTRSRVSLHVWVENRNRTQQKQSSTLSTSNTYLFYRIVCRLIILWERQKWNIDFKWFFIKNLETSPSTPKGSLLLFSKEQSGWQVQPHALVPICLHSHISNGVLKMEKCHWTLPVSKEVYTIYSSSAGK